MNFRETNEEHAPLDSLYSSTALTTSSETKRYILCLTIKGYFFRLNMRTEMSLNCLVKYM